MSHQTISSGVLFDPGRMVATPAFLDVATQDPTCLSNILRRHLRGDWGDLDAEDKARNDWSVTHGERILSAYHVNGTKVWVITEHDRSVTTFMLPSDY